MVRKGTCKRCGGSGQLGFIHKSTCMECLGLGYRLSDTNPPPAPPPRQTTKNESATKPDHYHSGGIDVFTFASANFTVDEVNAYHRITAIKYITRAGKKNGNPFEQDIKKAIVHLEESLKK